MTSAAARRARRLHAGYGASQVLFGVDLRRRARARSSALLGRNGMGKTTLVRSIMGLLRAARRRASRFAGAPIAGWPPHRIARARHRAGARRPAGVRQPERATST